MKKNKTWLGTTDPYVRLKRLESLDLETEYLQITQLFYADFQSTMVAKTYNGFMMNYAAPRVSRILSQTGELKQRVTKRIIDTIILASTVMEHGFTGKGRDAARRVNAMHRRYDIHPDDFIVVGSEEVVGSIEMAERYGWRPVTQKEREALNRYYSQQTRAFGSANPLPATYAETAAFYCNYLNTEIRYDPKNEQLAKVLVEWIGELSPKPMRPLFRLMMRAQLDHRIATSCGLRPTSRLTTRLTHKMLRRMAAADPVPDGAPNHLEEMVRRVYPNGYKIDEVGTHVEPAKELSVQT